MKAIYNGALRDLRDLVHSYPLNPAQARRLINAIQDADEALAFKAKYDEALLKRKQPATKPTEEAAHA